MSYLGDTKLHKTWTPGKEYVISTFCECLVLLNALALHRCCLFSFLLILLFLTQPPPPNTHTHRHTHITNSQPPRNTGLFINAQPLQTVLFKISIPFLMPGQIHLSPQDSAEVSFLPSSRLPLPLTKDSSVPLYSYSALCIHLPSYLHVMKLSIFFLPV